MRDLYANEIARAVHAGRTPDPFSVASWSRYDAELTANRPFNSVVNPQEEGEENPSSKV